MAAKRSGSTERLLQLIREGKHLSTGQRLKLTALLSFPAIVAQVSAIAMQYIDASMVGSLGAEASAAIGLVSTSTWLFWGMLSSCATGFSVQVAHLIGSSRFDRARQLVRQALVATVAFSVLLAFVGMAISGPLPVWLRADETIHADASTYFFIFSLFLPAMQLSFLAGAMLRCAGNMRVPSVLNVLMCVLDVALNFFLIFPSRTVHLLGMELFVPGAGMGVKGAALATVAAEAIVAAIMLYYLCVRYKPLRIWGEKGSFMPTRSVIGQAVKIGLPIGLEHIAICGAQILVTFIVAPLGVVAIAANAFAVIAESLCYMPGYGIGEAATTLSGQCLGAGRYRLMRSFGHITVGSAMVVMGVLGVALYIFAPQLMAIMSPVEAIRSLGAEILRIEAWAEPMFAAAIVTYGFFVGMGRTILPSIMNLGSIWAVRLTLAALLVGSMGLQGVWVAMCVELCFRGIIFLILLFSPKYYVKSQS
ncbi:MAG: MATE family efflux transporter [Firmicutes bacterium]|nr:MATE family efflux transporter [Bacillota bacterium]MCM1401707.1 MATE family efflux transporter [Bacteroides sp.]MCM1477959.1 MATE family efflux transporter [Bacteroides sp.]